MRIRLKSDRVVYVKGRDLVPHPKHIHLHGSKQKDAMEAILERLGFAGAILVYELPDGRYGLINGHMRAAMSPDDDLPCLVTDLTEAEAGELLAVYDQVGRMAEIDRAKFDALLGECNFHEGAIAVMFADLKGFAQAAEGVAPAAGGSAATAKPVKAEYPITPVFNEKYDYVVVFCKNTLDFAHLCTALGVGQQRSYRNSHVGLGRVIPFEQFMAAWRARPAEGSGG